MKRLILFFLALSFGLQFALSQVKLSDYKYVIVEKQFHFQNEPNEYNLNRLVKFLFDKHGFNAILEGEPLPSDLKANYCLAMTSEVKATGALRTKAQVILRDCENNVVYTSEEGSTKLKDFDRAYEMAIRKSFESFSELDYRYIPNERVVSQGNDSEESKAQQDEIKKLKDEIKILKESREEKEAEIKEDEKVTDSEVQIKNVKPSIPVLFATRKAESNQLTVSDINNTELMILIPSGRENLYLVKDANAIVFKEGGKWFHSKTTDDNQLVKEIDLRFQ